MADIGLLFEFVDAVDAHSPLPEELALRVDPAGIRRNLGRNMSAGEIACAFSHAKAYEMFLNSGKDYALILEDDAILGEFLMPFLTQGDYRKQPMFLLYHAGARVRNRTKISLASGVVAYRAELSPAGAVAYTVDRKTARILRAATEPLRSVADWPIELYEVGAYVTSPMIVNHPPKDQPNQSTLSADRGKTRFRPLRQILTRAYLQRKLRKSFARRCS